MHIKLRLVALQDEMRAAGEREAAGQPAGGTPGVPLRSWGESFTQLNERLACFCCTVSGDINFSKSLAL